MNETILSLDPGTTETAFCIVDAVTLKPWLKGKIDNMKMLWMMQDKDTFAEYNIKHVAIEMIAGMGMRVGEETFETVFWIGRFWQECKFEVPKTRIYRREEKTALLGTQKCKDKDIINYLVNRFAPNEPNYGKGTDKVPSWFHGFKADIWQSYAVAITYHKLYLTAEGRQQKAEAEYKRATNKIKKEEKKVRDKTNGKKQQSKKA